MRPELNLAEVIAMILEIEASINVKCLSYGLYDKTNKEYITESNSNNCFDYKEAYDNKSKFRYTYDKKLKDNAVVYLLKHHGELYFPMLKKGTQKAYVAQFDVTKLIAKYGEKHFVTPDKCFLPPVGCGCGRLNYETTVKPWIEQILDDRFVIVFRN